jgi:ABC-type nitrate/sulfonate/bicarbonate transport system substrate-binding protein
MQGRARRLATVVAGTLTVGALAPGVAGAATNVTVALGFKPDVVSTPYYVAQDMGYYKQAGLNVTLNYDKLPNPPQAVADGSKFQFGSSGGDAALLGASKGAAV